MIPFQKLATISVALLAISAPAYADSATDRSAALTAVAESYRPGVSGFGTVAAQDVDIDTKKHTVTVRFAKTAAYLPLTEADLSELKKDCLAALGPEYSRYKIKLFAGDRDMDSLALYSKKKNVGPKEKKPFVTRLDVPRAPSGLDGANIALWQSHGWYFEPKLNRWEWQRARLMQTVEDLYTQSYVMPFLMPMLENAGAYVMSPRERDIQRTEIIADNDGGQYAKGSFRTTGDWTDAGKPGFAYTKELLHNGDHPFADGTVLKAALSGKNTPTATATWSARMPLSGNYAVYISYATLPNSTEAAEYIVHADDGDHRFIINQRMGGGTWIYLGHIIIKRFPVSADTASDTRRMSGKQRAYLRETTLHIKQSHACCPLIEMSQYVFAGCRRISKNTLDHNAGRMRKRTGFIVIAISVQTIYAKFIPHFAIEFVFDSIHRNEIHQYSNRTSRHIPPTDSNLNPIRQRLT